MKAKRDKRGSPRVPYVTQLSVHYKDSVWIANSQDISNTGMFIESSSFPKIGAKILIGLELPHLGSVSIPAFVRWVNAHGFGVQFDLLGAKETHAIGLIVKNVKQ